MGMDSPMQVYSNLLLCGPLGSSMGKLSLGYYFACAVVLLKHLFSKYTHLGPM